MRADDQAHSKHVMTLSKMQKTKYCHCFVEQSNGSKVKV